MGVLHASQVNMHPQISFTITNISSLAASLLVGTNLMPPYNSRLKPLSESVAGWASREKGPQLVEYLLRQLYQPVSDQTATLQFVLRAP